MLRCSRPTFVLPYPFRQSVRHLKLHTRECLAMRRVGNGLESIAAFHGISKDETRTAMIGCKHDKQRE